MGDKERNTATCKAIAEEIEELGVYRYFEENDLYDIEYRTDSQGNYRSVEVMVACGGPNIYISTAEKEIQLYWGFDEAYYYLDTILCNQIDTYFEELYLCTR